MVLSATQKKRLEEIGAFLIEEGFSDVLADVRLLPKLHFLDRLRTQALAVGSHTQRMCNVLAKMGTTGEAFALFAAHRPDLFSQHERVAFASLASDSRNKKVHFDSETAQSLLKKLDGKTKFEQLPFLVTPFASYYRSSNRIAKLYHTHALTQIHADLQIIREILAGTREAQHAHWLTIICEFADFIVDYFSDNELATIKRTTAGALFTAKNGTQLVDVKKVLKHTQAERVAQEMVAHWFTCVFEKKQLLYDLYAWQWTNGISHQDIEPIVDISDRERKILLTFFTALANNDEQTAAACIISMCESTNASLDLAERLVSGHHAKQRHVFESGIAILEDALTEDMHIRAVFAKIVASGAQLIYIVKQYAPHNVTLFDELHTYLASHDVMLQQMIHKATMEAPMKQQKNQEVAHTHDQTTLTTQAIERLAKEIDKSSNRIAYSALIAAFTIAGALLVSNASQEGLLMLGVPFFVVAFITSLMLIASIAKEPK